MFTELFPIPTMTSSVSTLRTRANDIKKRNHTETKSSGIKHQTVSLGLKGLRVPKGKKEWCLGILNWFSCSGDPRIGFHVHLSISIKRTQLLKAQSQAEAIPLVDHA